MRPDHQDSSPPSHSNQHTVLVFTAVAVLILLPLVLFARFASGEGNPAVHPALTNIATVATAEPGTARPSSGAESLLTDAETTQPQSPSVRLEAGPWPFLPAHPTAPPPAVDADAYVVMERSCGALLTSHNERQRLAPASLTKIITAMVVSKRAGLNAMVEVNVSGSEMAKRGSSVKGLAPKMRLSVIDLLYGLFLPSGNDAAPAPAQHVSGDVRQFVALMNEEAARLGLRDTRFVNPHGLDAGGHYSTALDMANAGRAFLANPLLAQISTTPEYCRPGLTGCSRTATSSSTSTPAPLASRLATQPRPSKRSLQRQSAMDARSSFLYYEAKTATQTQSRCSTGLSPALPPPVHAAKRWRKAQRT